MIEVGKEAVCIRGHEGCVGHLKTGEIYTIEAIKKGFCSCATVIVNTGNSERLQSGKIAYMGDKIKCIGCGTVYISDGLQWNNINRFAPIDSVDIAELTEVLESEAFKID